MITSHQWRNFFDRYLWFSKLAMITAVFPSCKYKYASRLLWCSRYLPSKPSHLILNLLNYSQIIKVYNHDPHSPNACRRALLSSDSLDCM